MLVVVFHDAKSVGRFLAPEILRRVLGDKRDANIGCEKIQSIIHALTRSSGLCGVKLRISFTA